MPELPSPARLALIVALAVIGFTVGPLVDLVQWWRNRRRWGGAIR